MRPLLALLLLAACTETPEPDLGPAGWGERCDPLADEEQCDWGLTCWEGGYCTDKCDINAPLEEKTKSCRPVEGFEYICAEGCNILCREEKPACPENLGSVELHCGHVTCMAPTG